MLPDEMTSQQAADLLGVSRPFLVTNLQAYRKVGNRSRYLRTDVVEFARRMVEAASSTTLTWNNTGTASATFARTDIDITEDGDVEIG